MNQDDQDRIDGRKLAESCLADLTPMSEAFRFGFWRRIKQELPTQDLDPKAMADEEAREFGKQIVGFGKFASHRRDDVPLDYWEWLADENTKVQRYLRNCRIAAERAEE